MALHRGASILGNNVVQPVILDFGQAWLSLDSSLMTPDDPSLKLRKALEYQPHITELDNM
jgi:hypothetical protein